MSLTYLSFKYFNLLAASNMSRYKNFIILHVRTDPVVKRKMRQNNLLKINFLKNCTFCFEQSYLQRKMKRDAVPSFKNFYFGKWCNCIVFFDNDCLTICNLQVQTAV
jgi:hypothetical protein